MTPRLPSSKKWTSIPPELSEQIRSVFAETFSTEAAKGRFFVDGRIYAEELVTLVGYLENGRLRQANFEISVDFNPNKQNALEMIHFTVDCAASMMQEFFAEEQDFDKFPDTYHELVVEKQKAYVQLSTDNSILDAEANKLLGAEADDLVNVDDEEAVSVEEKKAVVTMLGLNDVADDFAETDIVEDDDDLKDIAARKIRDGSKLKH